jgi:4-hydroxy-4-methyl-2-oxoglutarate aldolase
MMSPTNLYAGYMRLSTAEVSDSLNSFGYCGALKGIRSHQWGLKFFGPAFTVTRTTNDDPNYCDASEFLDQVPAGYAIVIDNLGITDSTCWGGILTACAKNKQIQGTVINGVYRDAETVRALNYPVFSKGVFMVTGKGRTRLKGLNIPVNIEGVTIHPSDLIFGDANGVVVIPFEKAEEVLTRAEHIQDVEKQIERLVVFEGLTLREAREIMKYNQLTNISGSHS